MQPSIFNCYQCPKTQLKESALQVVGVSLVSIVSVRLCSFCSPRKLCTSVNSADDELAIRVCTHRQQQSRIRTILAGGTRSVQHAAAIVLGSSQGLHAISKSFILVVFPSVHGFYQLDLRNNSDIAPEPYLDLNKPELPTTTLRVNSRRSHEVLTGPIFQNGSATSPTIEFHKHHNGDSSLENNSETALLLFVQATIVSP